MLRRIALHPSRLLCRPSASFRAPICLKVALNLSPVPATCAIAAIDDLHWRWYSSLIVNPIPDELSSHDHPVRTLDLNAQEESASVSASSTPEDPPQGPNSQPKQLRKNHSKRKKRKRPHLVAFPLREANVRERAAELFDEIAPFLTKNEFRTLGNILRKRRNLASLQGTVSSKLDALWKKESPEQVPPDWVQKKITALIVGRPDDGFLLPESKAIHTEIKAPAPLRYKVNSDEMVAVLMKAREVVLVHNYCWSRREDAITRTNDSLEEEDGLQQRQGCHQEKSPEVLRQEAEQLLHALANTLPFEYLNAWISNLKTMTDAQQTSIKLKSVFAGLSSSVELHVHLVAHPIAEFFYFNISPEENGDKRFKTSLDRWNAQRKRFADTLLAFKNALEAQKKQTIAQIEEASMEVDLSLKHSVEPKELQRPRARRCHVFLDTMPLGVSTISVPNIENMIIVDNLPVDITEMELFELYSRCGAIESLKIFNYRPDLDPGPLNMKQLKERKKRQRMSRHKQPNGRWTNPRTPVYGLITFSSHEAYKNAIDSHLRIFGMVVRKHAIRSLFCSNVTTLYIENIPRGISAADLEYELSKTLKEENIYVWLNRQPHGVSDVTSCEIKFQSFEIAFGCYDRVRVTVERLVDGVAEHRVSNEQTGDDAQPVIDDDGVSRLAVNFLRTPYDAHMYWTREKGFE